MQINLICIGKRMPRWVDEAVADYTKRLPSDCKLNIVPLDLPKRSKSSNPVQLKTLEAQQLLQAANGQHIVALDIGGQSWSTEVLAEQLEDWREIGKNIALLVGGPDGLDASCLEQAQQVWSLSKLTLPHPLVRVMVTEQIYRAYTILQKHPYHR